MPASTKISVGLIIKLSCFSIGIKSSECKHREGAAEIITEHYLCVLSGHRVVFSVPCCNGVRAIEVHAPSIFMIYLYPTDECEKNGSCFAWIPKSHLASYISGHRRLIQKTIGNAKPEANINTLYDA